MGVQSSSPPDRQAFEVEGRRPWTSDSFVEVLRQRFDALTGQRKGERTKARLKVAAAEALEAQGYRDMKVADICRRADVSAAVLYLYYHNKTSLVLDVLTEFLNEFFATAKTPRAESLYDALRAANARWLRLARANAGLMKCLLDFSNEEPSFSRLYSVANHQWYQRSAEIWRARYADEGVDTRAMLLLAYTLGGMLDDIVRLLHINRDEHVVSVVAELGLDDDDLADFVSIIWYRALTGREPAGPRGRAAELFRPLGDLVAQASRSRPGRVDRPGS